MTPATKMFNGKRYVIYTMRVSKKTAQSEMKFLRRRIPGVRARIVPESGGKYSVYMRGRDD